MAFNNLEVEVTRERVKSGLENARSKGVVLGRPKLTKEDIPDKFYRNLDLYTSKSSNIGNKALEYSIGTITYDELIYAGITNKSNNLS